MSRRVKRYELTAPETEHQPVFDLQIPMGARLLKITTSAVRRRCWLWVEVNQAAPIVPLRLQAFEAGAELPEEATYVDTVIGTAVYHVYQVPPPPTASAR